MGCSGKNYNDNNLLTAFMEDEKRLKEAGEKRDKPWAMQYKTCVYSPDFICYLNIPCSDCGRYKMSQEDKKTGLCPFDGLLCLVRDRDTIHTSCTIEECVRHPASIAAQVISNPEVTKALDEQLQKTVESAHEALAALKYDEHKLDWSLLPLVSVEEVIKVLMHGAQKYSEDNWQKLPDFRKRYINAMYRHLASYAKGEVTDKESGLSHMAHAACNALFLIWKEMDEKPLTEDELKKLFKPGAEDESSNNK